MAQSSLAWPQTRGDSLRKWAKNKESKGKELGRSTHNKKDQSYKDCLIYFQRHSTGTTLVYLKQGKQLLILTADRGEKKRRSAFFWALDISCGQYRPKVLISLLSISSHLLYSKQHNERWRENIAVFHRFILAAHENGIFFHSLSNNTTVKVVINQFFICAYTYARSWSKFELSDRKNSTSTILFNFALFS